jgi:transcriptional regulator with XRE-family HTH domain
MRQVDKKAFGRRVQERRESLGISQTELAEAVGMRQQGINNIEHGIVGRPRLLRELAGALHTTEQWLLWRNSNG